MKTSTNPATEIALHFIKVTEIRTTPLIIKKTTNQAKSLLSNGYTKEEIISVIDYIINNKKATMYSLGYISASINNMLIEINKSKKQIESKIKSDEIKTSLASIQDRDRDEVKTSDESTQRNRNKSNRFGIESRFREESFSDLFKGK